MAGVGLLCWPEWAYCGGRSEPTVAGVGLLWPEWAYCAGWSGPTVLAGVSLLWPE